MIKFQNAATFSIVLKKVSRPTANFRRQRKLLIIIVTIIRMRTSDDCGIVGLTLS